MPPSLLESGVADHHLLDVTPQLDQPAVGRCAEQVPQDRADAAQIVDRLEQRDEPEPGHPGPEIDQTDVAGQYGGGQHVVDVAGHRHDVALDDVVAPRVHLRPQRRHQRQRRRRAVVGVAG